MHAHTSQITINGAETGAGWSESYTFPHTRVPEALTVPHLQQTIIYGTEKTQKSTEKNIKDIHEVQVLKTKSSMHYKTM